jgi:hypothetical protein
MKHVNFVPAGAMGVPPVLGHGQDGHGTSAATGVMAPVARFYILKRGVRSAALKQWQNFAGPRKIRVFLCKMTLQPGRNVAFCVEQIVI